MTTTLQSPDDRLSRRICEAADCDRPHHGHGLCLMHYKRRRTALRNPKKTPLEKYWEHVTEVDGCWEWAGPRDQDGYGCLYVTVNGQLVQRAHRAAWALFRGPIPEGTLVRHRCDNPPCCNPDHLRLGTHQDNTDDKVSRNRQASGRRLPQTRLTDEEVREIRATYRVVKRKSNATELAETYGVSQRYIMHLVSGRGRENAK